MDEKNKKPEKNNKTLLNIIQFIFLFFLVVQIQSFLSGSGSEKLAYSEFKKMLFAGQILQVDIYDNSIEGKFYYGDPSDIGSVKYISLKDGTEIARSELEKNKLLQLSKEQRRNIRKFNTVRIYDKELIQQLDRAGVNYKGEHRSFLVTFFFEWILPPAFIIFIWLFLMKKIGGIGPDVLSFGKSRAKFSEEAKTGVSFEDVAGLDEAKEELEEVVIFLREPEKYKKLGAKIPKGVLLVGPPGCGKTLLAKAIAGEAKVPFMSISGSDFVEMFVGVGASRVRDLFSQAKEKGSCIIFIDEIDAIGKFRGGHPFGGNDEREQTLNALLVEMDGFEVNTGIILLAATNRPDVLDPALLRPGRFDRRIVVDPADAKGREEILNVHIKDKPLDEEVDIKEIALHTPGFSGADLANLANEAALLAARRSQEFIHHKDLRDAMERVMAGPERKSRRIGVKERKIVAYHEAGHALVASFCEHATPVSKISIVPRGQAALGYTLTLPEEDRFLVTKSEILDQIAVALGGRAAEEIIFNEISSGAHNDLEKITEMAKSIVCRFGMSEKLGPVSFSKETMGNKKYNFDNQEEFFGKSLSKLIDSEVQEIIDTQYTRSKTILNTNLKYLEEIASTLLEKEVISQNELADILKGNGEENPDIKPEKFETL